MLNKCGRCKKELVDGTCRNSKCPINKMRTGYAVASKQSVVKNPKYRKAVLEQVMIPQAKAAYGPDSEKVKELQEELAREVRYHG